ncbi:MAG: trigger factor [Proteobacteria bacterium]|nr:trigger factor [Pseudomonadota bacterium]
MTTPQIEEVNSTRRKFRIEVPSSSVKSAFDVAVSEIQLSAEIKGFRKGKVPSALVRKFFAQDVAKKAYEKAVNDSYSEAVKTVDFQIVSFPMIDVEGQFEEGKQFTYTATVDINPKVEIQGYKELTLKTKEKEPEIDDQVSRTIRQLASDADRLVEETSGRAAAKQDAVKVDYKINVDGKELAERASAGVTLHLDGSTLPELEAGIIGMKTGETKTIKVVYPETVGDENLKGKTAEFKLTLNSIHVFDLTKLDDVFAQRFGAENLDALRSTMRNQIQNMNERNKVAQFKDDIIKQILDKNTFDVPESLIEGTIDRAVADANSRREKGSQLDSNNETVRNQYREWATSEVKGVLALGHIARQEGLTVDDREVGQELTTFAMQAGVRPQDLLKNYGQQVIEEFRGKVLVDKVLKHLVGLAKVEVENAKA